jgi:hypothetical protein
LQTLIFVKKQCEERGGWYDGYTGIEGLAKSNIKVVEVV